MEKRWSHKVGAGVLSQLPVSPGDWSSVMPRLRLTFWRRAQKGWLHMHDWNGPKSFLYIRGMHQANFNKWSRSVPLCLFCLSFTFFVLLIHIWTIHMAGQMWDLRTGGLCPLSLFSTFISLLLCFGQIMSVIFYSILHTEVCCGSGEV